MQELPFVFAERLGLFLLADLEPIEMKCCSNGHFYKTKQDAAGLLFHKVPLA